MCELRPCRATAAGPVYALRRCRSRRHRNPNWCELGIGRGPAHRWNFDAIPECGRGRIRVIAYFQ
jgi:hypothetical protein